MNSWIFKWDHMNVQIDNEYSNEVMNVQMRSWIFKLEHEYSNKSYEYSNEVMNILMSSEFEIWIFTEVLRIFKWHEYSNEIWIIRHEIWVIINK